MEGKLGRIHITRLPAHATGFLAAVKKDLLTAGQEVMIDRSPPGLDIQGQIVKVIATHADTGVVELLAETTRFNVSLGCSPHETRHRQFMKHMKQMKQTINSWSKKVGDLWESVSPSINFTVAGHSALTLVGKGNVPRNKKELAGMAGICLASALTFRFKPRTTYSPEGFDSSPHLPFVSASEISLSDQPAIQAGYAWTRKKNTSCCS